MWLKAFTAAMDEKKRPIFCVYSPDLEDETKPLSAFVAERLLRPAGVHTLEAVQFAPSHAPRAERGFQFRLVAVFWPDRNSCMVRAKERIIIRALFMRPRARRRGGS